VFSHGFIMIQSHIGLELMLLTYASKIKLSGLNNISIIDQEHITINGY